MSGPSVELMLSDGDLTALLEAFDRFDAVWIVDAVESGAPSGVLHVFDLCERPLPQSLRGASTHVLGLSEAVELARALGQLPPSLRLYGIEGGDYAPTAGLSAPVQRAIPALVERIVAELRSLAPRLLESHSPSESDSRSEPE